MTITRSPRLCDGFPMVMIKYVLHGGIQKPYHDNRGASFHGDSHLAYLPDSPQGNRLLKRLIFAFCHGLTFRVGASLTTGQKNCTTWASIHHKTSVQGGVHGFPDPSYFQDRNKELDNFGVPEDPSYYEGWKYSKCKDNSNYQDRIAAQKKKVIRQQQRRLLLLRHALKCKEGPACKAKFCGQIMTLWKHVKKCRDKNCKTSHCLISGCVLNHYQICKSQGQTSTCKVCGPVMEQIKRQDQGEGMDNSDPLAAKPDPDLPNQALPQLQQQMSSFGGPTGAVGGQQNNVQAMQQQAMQQLYQQQQQAIQQNQQGPQQGMQNQHKQQNSLQALGGGSVQGNQTQNDDLQNSQSSGGQTDPQQLQQLQSAQQKLYQQQQVLKQLQKQQAQLLEQQKQLQEQQQHLKDPQTQQGQQLQQQHALLQQLQRRCQQQQALIQQELVLQMKALQQGGQGNQQMGNNSQSSQHSQHTQQSQHSQQQMSRQNSVGSQNQNQNQTQNIQGNQLQAQMQALSQSHMQALNDNNKSNNAMNQMQNQMQNPMQNQMQNQMQGQMQMQNPMQNQMLQNQMQNQMQGESGNQGQLQQSLGNQGFNQTQQALNAQQGGSGSSLQEQALQQAQQQQALQQAQQQQAQQASQAQQPREQETQEQPPDSPANSSFNNISQPMSQPLSDGSEKGSNSKRRTSVKARTIPAAGRGKGARGRGGKGKRLRDIADDLGAGVNHAGASINKSSAEAAASSVLSKKRTSGMMSGSAEEGDNTGEPAMKTSKSDVPDLEKSEKEGKEGSEAKDSEKKEGEGDQNASLASSMPKGDVEQHLLLLHKGLHLTSRTITHKCLPIVQQLIDDPYGWVFRDAVDPVVFGLPDYFEVVKNPMHLLLVKKKLENAVYTDMASFERDVKLVFENAILYNGEDSEVGQLANTMMGVFEREYKKVCEVLKNNLHSVDANACTLCGTHRRQFEPPVLYCVGMSCGMQRIRRNATYFTDATKQNCWCAACYSKLKEYEVITLDDGAETKKSRLQSAKHDSLPEETWVECDDCKSRVHQICALYNGRRTKERSNVWCPKCTLVNRGDDEKPSESTNRAQDLPKCKMSDSMEAGLEKTLAAAYEAKARELGVGVDEVEKAKGLSIRVLSHIEKHHAVRDLMFQRYSKIGCPSDFPVHTKCVGLFQSLDGVDVLLFAMYVYEYGQDCPAPNQRRVYISYLDSVQYFEPRVHRTVAYQAVIVEYLRFVKKRGFHTAHIWSCPPTPGDEYVFYCHPSYQKVPQEDMLRNWYYQVLDKAKAEGIVVETTNFHDEYFKNGGTEAPIGSAVDLRSLPYFEGDYIPGEIENILSHLTKEEGRLEPEPPTSSSHGPPRRTGSKLGTRSNPGRLVNQTQDKIMLRLGKGLFNMKENLMIVRLRSKRFVAAFERGDDVSAWPDDEDSLPQNKGKDSSILFSGSQDDEEANVEVSLKSGFDEIKSSLARHFTQVKRSSNKIGSTVDEDQQFESEMFENRQLFLNYCQVNHCQFDELRRAKHSTMMVLFQLHNPMAPKFLQQCGACYRDIANGSRFHCNTCANFDLCEDCYRPVLSGAWRGRGSRFTHDQNHTFSRIKVENSVDTKTSQGERIKSLKMYLEVLSHAANCGGPPACRLNNCEKMKKLFVHVKTCEITHKKGCKICARLLSLIIVHARSCTVRGTCSLPFCDRIRERNERLRRQQQLMDDRRRQAQNDYYRSIGD